MTTKFIHFLNNIEGASLRAATDDEIKRLKELTDKLPDVFVEIFSQAMPEDAVFRIL